MSQAISEIFNFLTGPYQIREEIRHLTVTLRGSRQDIPFSVLSLETSFWIQFRASEKLTIKRKNASVFSYLEIIFNGNECDIAPSAVITVKALEGDQLFISDSLGNEWSSGFSFKFRENTFKPLHFLKANEIRNQLQSLIKSGMIHFSSIMVLFLICNLSRWAPGLAEYLEKQKKYQVSAKSTIITAEEAVFKPFIGMGIKAFEIALRQERIEKELMSKPIAERTAFKISQILKGINIFNGGGSLPKGLPQIDGPGKINIHALVDGVLKESQEKTHKALQTREEPGLVGFTKREIMIRQALDTLRPKLSLAYDEALRIDPSISVSLKYEGTINQKGYISNIRLQAHGVGSSVALTMLQDKVRRTLEELMINREYSGTVLNGEHVFVR